MLLELRDSGGSQIDDVTIKAIKYPIMAGGPSTAEFTVFGDELDIGDYIEVREEGGVITRFQGYIRRKSRQRDKEHGGTVRDYTAICKSYYEYARQNVGIYGYGDEEDDFSGNNVEYQDWLYRENCNYHVTWPPTGDAPVIFDDQSEPVALPENIISIGEVEENNLPSHIKIEVKKYIEKRFPVVADWDTELGTPTAEMLKKNPKYANYGRQFKLMDPDDATEEYTDRPCFNAAIGGSKFFCKGHSSLKFPKSEDYGYSASINPKRKDKCLQKEGGGAPGGTEKKNSARVQMTFYFGYELPRVEGAHGSSSEQQQCYVRARYLEQIQALYEDVGGINAQDRLPSINHVEIEVEYDTYDGSHYRDWTFGGAKGLLDASADLGGGVWTSNLDGTYIVEEGITRAAGLLSSALSHYQIQALTTDILFAGTNWAYNKKVNVGGDSIVLDGIEWTFGLKPEENRTRYNGVKLLYGFSQALQKKKKWGLFA